MTLICWAGITGSGQKGTTSEIAFYSSRLICKNRLHCFFMLNRGSLDIVTWFPVLNVFLTIATSLNLQFNNFNLPYSSMNHLGWINKILMIFFSFFFFIFFLCYLPSPMYYLHPWTFNPNARGSDACSGSNVLWTTTKLIHKDRPPWMCGQHNVRATAEDNTGPRRNRTRATGLEGKDSIDHSTMTEYSNYMKTNLKYCWHYEQQN